MLKKHIGFITLYKEYKFMFGDLIKIIINIYNEI